MSYYHPRRVVKRSSNIPFAIVACLILIFAIGVVWWQAILVMLLASIHVNYEVTY